VFDNNTAGYGGAVYLEQMAYVEIDDNATIQFINNSVTEKGGAIFIDAQFCKIFPFKNICVTPNHKSASAFMYNCMNEARFMILATSISEIICRA